MCKLLCNPPVLKLSDFEKPFVIDTDVYKDATGAVLLQYYDGSLHPIVYHSSKYARVECNYGGWRERAVGDIPSMCQVAMLH